MQASTLRIAIRTVLVVVACLTEGRLSWCGVKAGMGLKVLPRMPAILTDRSSALLPAQNVSPCSAPMETAPGIVKGTRLGSSSMRLHL